jgi:hypothetical protein
MRCRCRVDANKQRIAKEKARNLKGEQHSSAPHKEHAPGWNEHLAVCPFSSRDSVYLVAKERD